MFVILNLILLLVFIYAFFFFFKQKTAYEMRISDWSSDVCSSDLLSLAGTRDTIRLLSWLRTNAPGAKAIVVVNRIVNTITPEVSRKDFEASIEHGIDFAIPYDFKVAVAAAKNGKCLADAAVSSKLAAPLAGLARSLLSGAGSNVEDNGGSPSLLGNLKSLLASKGKLAKAE